MRYKVDVKENFEQSLLFWLDRFIKSKLTSLSNRHVEENAKLSAIIGSLNHGSESMDDLKNLAKEARNIGLIGINLFINPLEKFYHYLTPMKLGSLKEIDEELLSEFLASQTGSLSDATKKNYRIALLGLFKFIDKQNEDESGSSYQFRIELKNWGGLGGRKGEKLPAHMYKEELTRFFKAIEETEFKPYAQAKNRLLIKLILYTGMRVSEALGMRLKDMVKDGEYYVFQIRGKGNKPRTAMVKVENIAHDLEEWMGYRSNESMLLFQSRTGKPLTQAYVSYIMDKMLLHAGIRKEKNGAHMLRHTFATLLYQKNHDLILVQEALGHADLNTSRIYTHFDKERLKIAADTMDGME
ncbi:tyrosine-type recombinase/integrase [Sulfurospirillum halorespirans]|uniref:Tyrosine recombinase XerH n=1 Tax=Sulfurospirillum halorespirans DSM 13726 TaxID=1193502 RepID=A0A1D7TK90_9BACT|nr:tyrosine-type recombinase/integrase [Sulfurospirillum halorespirans]AOO65415.1 integrase-recombinase, XerDC family [Sulfurospirillum halorespirans DSM 13726]